MLRRCVLCALLLATSSPARALDASKRLSGCTVDTWRSRDGLPGAWVRAIAQSPDGYLWLGTQGGLVRYGGGRMVPVQPERAFEEAADVVGLHAARDGTLWILPARGAPVCLRAGALGGCLGEEHWPEGVRVSAVDEDAEGTLWIASSDGIHRLRDRHLERVQPARAWGQGNVTAVHRDRQGRLWVGTSAGLFVSAGGGALVAADPPGATLAVNAIFEARDHLWVAADHALVRVDGGAAVVAGDSVQALRRTTSVVEDRDGNVWVGTRAGLVRYQAGHEPETFTRADGLPDDDITAVFEDREGSLWVGTHGGGLAQFTDRTLDGQAGPPSLRDQWISSVAEDEGGVLWVGTALGLTRWKDGKERTFTSADGLPSDQVLAVLPGPDGVLWIGTEKGLARWRGGRIEVPVAIDAPIPSLLWDGDALWMGAGEGVARLAGEQLERIPPVEGLRGVSEVRGLARDDRGTMWISGGGRLLNVEGGKLVKPSAARVGKVRSLFRDGDGTLWLGTRDGLVRVRNGVWRTFGAAEGLERADFYQVIADDRGGLWVGASQGLLRITRASLDELDRGKRARLDVLSFDVSDQGREVGATRTRQPGAWKGRDGRLWFATQRGVVSVDPARVQRNAVAPPVFVEEAIVDGRRARRGANEFPPGSGAMEFHFAAITLLEPQKAQHRYRLEGFEDHWVEAGTRRVAYYTNVRPGHYRFRVQGSNADGVWNEAGDALSLTLAPHFHQTWFFYGGAALAVLGLVLAFHRMRLAQVHGRYVATFAERTRVARELHDSLLQGMAAVLMRLRGLRKLYGGAVPRPSDGAITGEITEIEEVVAANIEETRRLLWDLRGESRGAVDLGAALGRLAQKLGGARGVEVRPTVEGTPTPLPQHVCRELLLITQEAITNALEHAAPTKIDVHLQHQPRAVVLTIRDDGRGFDAAAAPGAEAGHFGLQGMRERAAALGTFSVESRPGEGTRIVVSVSRQELHDG